MLGDLSGLTDTIWGIIENAIGVLNITMAAYGYLKKDQSFFEKNWIRSFIEKNPKLFKE